MGSEHLQVLFELDLVHAFFVLLHELDTILFAYRDNASDRLTTGVLFVQTYRSLHWGPGVRVVRGGSEHHLVKVESLVTSCLESSLLRVEVLDLLEPLGLLFNFDDFGQFDLLVGDFVSAVELAQVVN